VTEQTQLAVVGATGYLGRALHRAAREGGRSAFGSSRRDDALPVLDLRAPDIDGLELAASGHTHAAIAAGVTVVADCERDPEGAWAVNVDGPLELARQLELEGIVPILFSSDYVFDGREGAYDEDAETAPTTEYGRQKAALEAGVRERHPGALVIRLGKVYGTSRGEGTLLDEMAATLAAGRTLRAAADQVMTPVLLADAVAATLALATCGAAGVVNVCGPEVWSRAELAHALAASMRVESALVETIALDDLDEGFVRPKRTDMVARRLLAETDVRPAPVSEAIPVVAANYSEVTA
jgi:dTDP-4-dehydrorhamnose reductase